ncbi:MAG: saccharopine dehydrogenase NADP-binding domain-containing protein [Nannocystaceae bacterium]
MARPLTWMLYGANGYTGEMIAERARSRGLRPILAGRRHAAIYPLAERLGCEPRIFSLRDPDEVAHHLEDVDTLVLAAGPFSRTSAVAVEACLRARTHYLDITGEIAVFEAAQARDDDARERGVILLPGVGFDVVPSDCLARALADALPGADTLELAFYSRGGVSRGTLKTSLEGAQGQVRRGGVLRPIRLGSLTRSVPFPDRERTVVAIPWGDLATAAWSTKIPNITTYMAMPPRQIRGLALTETMAPLLRLRPVQRILHRVIDRVVAGPDPQTREAGFALYWGRVSVSDGREVVGHLRTPETYTFTADATVASVLRLAEGRTPPGYHTPSTAFGSEFVTTLEGCTLDLGEVDHTRAAASS